MSADSPPTGRLPMLTGGTPNTIISRFRSHLAQRNRNITDFYIEPDDPWRAYFPGDSVKGTVVLTVVRPVRITHLVVCLHGFVKVFKNTIAAGETPPEVGLLPGRGRRGAEYLGNGLASLFEDEVVLCGDGRLKEGIYKFRFDMAFPPYALPSSINFERGTISYMLTSTLTKPTTINPTVSCRRRINFLESIDISSFPPPRARIVTLEPVSKRSRPKVKRKPTKDSQDSADLSASGSVSITGAEPRPPLSPVPSNVSSSSRPSNSSQSFQTISDPSSTGIRNNDTRIINTERMIIARTEVMRAGILPGDTLPIKLTVNHNKQVRSAHGVIVTLYRQGRIELHPLIPIGSPTNGKKPVYEDVYPRSRTGLGGLAIGSGSTNSMFRKDLSQTFAPLVVDPTTLTAVVKTSVRVPENVFPTITRVPGSMINFRYYVEVVADLRGKLTLPERFLPRFSMVSGGRTYSPSGQVLNGADTGTNSLTSNWTGNILDTDQIRREKGVIAVAFEVVVGTHDSERAKKEDLAPTGAGAEDPSPTTDTGDWQPGLDSERMLEQGYESYQHTRLSEPEPYQLMACPPEPQGYVDEKAQLRLAAEMLLPSQPPVEPEAGPSGGIDVPTAPILPDDDYTHSYQHLSLPADTNEFQTTLAGPAAAPGSAKSRTADKQELERQRLMQGVSAPAQVEDCGEGPSAPVLDDEAELVGGPANGDESLPQYRR